MVGRLTARDGASTRRLRPSVVASSLARSRGLVPFLIATLHLTLRLHPTRRYVSSLRAAIAIVIATTIAIVVDHAFCTPRRVSIAI